MLDADIRGFFDNISHEWMMKFLQHRIADRRLLRLVGKWLRAGVIEQDQWKASEAGTPQGATISPLLANIYLHYVLDTWAHHWRRTHARGQMILVRYADDFVMGFEHREEILSVLVAVYHGSAETNTHARRAWIRETTCNSGHSWNICHIDFILCVV